MIVYNLKSLPLFDDNWKISHIKCKLISVVIVNATVIPCGESSYRAFSWFLVHVMLNSRRTWGFTYTAASWGFLHLLDVHLHAMTGEEKSSVKWCEWFPQASQSYLHLSLCKHVFLVVLHRLLARYSDSCSLALRLEQTCCPADTKIHTLTLALWVVFEMWCQKKRKVSVWKSINCF